MGLTRLASVVALPVAGKGPFSNDTTAESSALPRVSVLIPCHNAEIWIGDAVRSAIKQSFEDKEVVVFDDGSTDESLAIIQSFGDRIRWESGPNLGGNAARNRLLELAKGEWLQYLDADDFLLPDKIANQARFLEKRPETDVVYGPVVMEHHAGGAVSQEVLEIPEPHDEWILLARWYLPQTGAPLWRRQALLDVGGWKPDQPACQEHELYLRMLMAGKKFAYCPSAGAVYRQWGEHTVCKRDKPLVRKLRMEIEQQAEEFLRQQGKLTPERLWAINMARFELARMAWRTNPDEARDVMAVIGSSDPRFLPSGAAAPRRYRSVYRIAGFEIAERIASAARWLRS